MNASPELIFIDDMRHLPALPAAVIELLDMLCRDGVETRQVAATLSLDPVLAAKTLRLANSSFYGLPRRVSSVTEAVGVLGLGTVKTLVLTAAVAARFSPPRCEGFDLQAFWRHSVAAAVFARLAAKQRELARCEIDAEEAFTAGLLHDIGRLVLANASPANYERVLSCGQGDSVTLSQRELEGLGIDHATVGARLAEKWRLPVNIVDAVAHHHDVSALSRLPVEVRTSTEGLRYVVAMADRLAHAFERGEIADGMPSIGGERYEAIGVDIALDRILAMTDEAREQIDSLCRALLND